MTRPAVNESRHPLRAIVSIVIGLLGLCLPAASYSATTATWHGGGVDNNWSTTANWTLDPTGASATQIWAAADDAVFTTGVLGTDATNPYTITVTASLTAAGLVDNMSGSLLLTGNSGQALTLGADTLPGSRDFPSFRFCSSALPCCRRRAIWRRSTAQE